MLAANSLLTVGILVALVGGLSRLVRLHGVTIQVVAGALTIYVLTGLIFAWVVSLVAEGGSAAYFAQGGDATQGERVYYSFTVLTTTGFGDLTAATPVGQALVGPRDADRPDLPRDGDRRARRQLRRPPAPLALAGRRAA